MAILFRNTAGLTVGGMTARLTVYYTDGYLRTELAPDAEVSTTVYTGTLNVTVTYNGTNKNLASAPFTKAVSAVFPAADGQKSLVLSSAAGIVYGGTASSSITISWKGDGSLPVPSLEISYASGLLVNHGAGIRWQVDGVPEGYLAYTLGVWMYHAPRTGIAPAYTRSCLIDRKSTDFALEHTISGLAEKNCVFYRIAVGLYRANGADFAGRDDYELYLETDSPVYVCSGDSVYTIAPYDLRYSGIRRNRVVNVSWKVLPAAVQTEGFRLEYTYDNSTWYMLFWNTCPSNSYSFTLPEGKTKIAFRMFSYSTRSKYEQSEYLYGPWLEAGRSNVYVGHNGSVVPAAEVHIGSAAANAALNVG